MIIFNPNLLLFLNVLFWLSDNAAGIKFYDKHKKHKTYKHEAEQNSNFHSVNSKYVPAEDSESYNKYVPENGGSYKYIPEESGSYHSGSKTGGSSVHGSKLRGHSASQGQSSFFGEEKHHYDSSGPLNAKEHGGHDEGIFSHLESLKQDFISDIQDGLSGGKGAVAGSLKQKFVGEKDLSDKEEEKKSYLYDGNQPACPIKIKPSYEEEIVEQVLHSVVTINKDYDITQWEYVTETVTYPVTVTDISTVTHSGSILSVTETLIVPEEKTITEMKFLTVDKTILDTSLSITTYTLTNTLTTTNVVPEYVTVTDHTTKYTTKIVPVESTTTEWVTQVVSVTQPIHVTTVVSVDAPQLEVVTSTETHPHYMTTTQFATKVVYTTVCEEKH